MSMKLAYEVEALRKEVARLRELVETRPVYVNLSPPWEAKKKPGRPKKEAKVA